MIQILLSHDVFNLFLNFFFYNVINLQIKDFKNKFQNKSLILIQKCLPSIVQNSVEPKPYKICLLLSQNRMQNHLLVGPQAK